MMDLSDMCEMRMDFSVGLLLWVDLLAPRSFHSRTQVQIASFCLLLFVSTFLNFYEIFRIERDLDVLYLSVWIEFNKSFGFCLFFVCGL